MDCIRVIFTITFFYKDHIALIFRVKHFKQGPHYTIHKNPHLNIQKQLNF